MTKFLKLAESAQTEEQRNLFLQQHYRQSTRDKIDNCRACSRYSGLHTGFWSKTPAFVSFVTAEPMQAGPFIDDLRDYWLPGIGLKLEDVCCFSMVSCVTPANVFLQPFGESVAACKENFDWQIALSSSRVFVLVGDWPASLIYKELPNMQDIAGTWVELVKKLENGVKFKQFFFFLNPPNYLQNSNRQLIRQTLAADFRALDSLIKYAWAVNIQELYPGSDFQHELTYEQMCDVVANDVKKVLLSTPPHERTDVYMQLMLRVCRDNSGHAVRAFWDDDMARRCGVDPAEIRNKG